MKLLSVIILIFLTFAVDLLSQNIKEFNDFDFKAFKQKRDSLRKFDFLSYNYRLITKDYQIKIDDKTFKKGVAKYKFVPEGINDYKDSLAVVCMIEFDDWDKTHIAVNRIGYTWLRLGYHTWQTKVEAKGLLIYFI